MTNVLVIMVDDMRADMLPYMPAVQNRLVRQGRNFTQARVHTPVCAPSRLGFMMAQYAQTNDTVNGNGTLNFDINNQIFTWASTAGYRTAMIGKFMNQFPDAMAAPTGVTWWRQFPDNYAYDLLGFGVVDNAGFLSFVTDGTEQTTYIREQLEAFITADPATPWFAYLATADPHTPFNALRGDVTKFHDLEWPLVLEADVSDKPSWIQAAANSTAAQQRLLQFYAKMQIHELTRLDQMVDECLDAIDNLSDLSDTVVIFTSDNGLTYGEHRVSGGMGVTKNDLYEPSCRVPLVVRGPGFPVGTNDEHTMVGQDVSATILDVTGATSALAQSDGLSLVDLVANGAVGPWANRAVACWRGETVLGNNPHKGWSIVQGNMKLMRWERLTDLHPALAADDVYEMYDLAADPNEHTNLANLGGAYLTQRTALVAALDAWITTPT